MVPKTDQAGRAEVSAAPVEAWPVWPDDFAGTREYLASDDAKHGMRELVLQHQIYKLRTLRKSQGITQVQLAARLGVSQIRISQIENGRLEKFELGTLIRYVEALGGELELGVAIAGRRINLLDIEQADATDTTEAG